MALLFCVTIIVEAFFAIYKVWVMLEKQGQHGSETMSSLA